MPWFQNSFWFQNHTPWFVNHTTFGFRITVDFRIMRQPVVVVVVVVAAIRSSFVVGISSRCFQMCFRRAQVLREVNNIGRPSVSA